MDIKNETIKLIDSLKATCQTYGMGNDGNEYKIITQTFQYKFMNDKFGYEIKKISPILANSEKWEIEYKNMDENEREKLLDRLSPDIPKLEPQHLISNLWNQQAKGDFADLFDSTMLDIANKNISIFSTQTILKTKVPLFEKLTGYVTDMEQRTPFARALVDKLVNFSFEEAFEQNYDFFATIFEHLIKDYNTNGGGKYAEYYTPHAIASIMAKLLVGEEKDLHNIEIYDPSAGTGTLLIALAHQIGEEKCTVFSQDISQKSSKMLQLNLILNNLVASLDNVIQGDTLVSPYHKSDNGEELRQFDYIVSNPPFKLDFPDTRSDIVNQTSRFWAGVPNIPKNIDPQKPKMAIYTCFLQHVINSLSKNGKGAIVVPTGFITSKSGIENKILKRIVDEHIVYGCISMPSNVFATTGTNVSVLFFDNSKKSENVILIDASKLGEEYQEGNTKKKRLRPNEINKIVNTFLNKEIEEKFSVVMTYEEIKNKAYSLSAGQYFKIRIDYKEISKEDFDNKVDLLQNEIKELFSINHENEKEILKQMEDFEHV